MTHCASVALLLLMVAALGCQSRVAPVAASALPATTQATDDSLKVMTFNLRYASIKPPNAWWQRRQAMK